MAVAFFIAYRHTYSLQIIPRPSIMNESYNPDNYLWSRAHVWGNCVHLVWTISLCCILTLCMIGYGIAMSIFALVCYRFSQTSVVLLVLSAGLLVFTYWWRKQFLQQGDTSWIERGKQTTILGAIIAIAVLGMITVSLFTIPLV